MPAYAAKVMDHAAYRRKVRRMSVAELLFTADDCRTAIRAMPDGPNVGYYTDEIIYCEEELLRRSRGGVRTIPTVAEVSREIVSAALAVDD